MKKSTSLITVALATLLLNACSDPVATSPVSGDDDHAADEHELAIAEPLQTQVNLQEIEIALGSAVKRLCSSVLVSGRSQQHVMANELSSPALAEMSFSIADNIVSGSNGDQTVEALFRPHLGCTLMKNTSAQSLQVQFDSSKYPLPSLSSDAPWPLGDQVDLPTASEAREQGADLPAIQAAVALAFEDIEPNQNIDTRAVVVIHKGRIIAEQYAEPFHAGMPQLGWSMTKTVTAVLAGMLAGDGLLHIDVPAAVSEWQAANDPRSRITLNNLLQMSSGLEFSEVYTANSMSDVILMLYTTGDTAAYTVNKPLQNEPDSHWSYASGTSNIIARIQRQLFDNYQSYFNYPKERLFNKLAMNSAVLEPDASGTFVGSSYMYATPRDWAKIGLLYMQDGVWNGERLLPEGWVEYSLTPARAAPGGNYGAQIWLNAGDEGDPESRPMPNLPANAYYLSGFEGQNIVMLPDQELIVMRMGVTTNGPRPIWALTEAVLKAVD